MTELVAPSDLAARPGRIVHTFPETEPIVGLAVVNDRIFVATSRSLYVLGDDDELRSIPFAQAPE